MSHSGSSSPSQRRSLPSFTAKKGKEKLVVLTACSSPMAALMDGLVDMLLVGDSLGMALYGMESTHGVTLDQMIAHARAVMRGSRQASVVVDLPFGSYQESPGQAFASAARVIAESGAQGVKLEGGAEMAETISFLAARGVPVMGHVGLLPQHVHTLGGYGMQGKSADAHARILADATAVAHAGAFALVIENVTDALAAEITGRVAVPTIGIGAGPACDGQVLVAEDMLGMFEKTPPFVKRYADLAGVIKDAVHRYAGDVREGTFPPARNGSGAK